MKILNIILSKKVLGPILSIIIGYIIYKIIKSLIKKVFSFRSVKADKNKVKMISDLVTNIVKYFIIVIVFLLFCNNGNGSGNNCFGNNNCYDNCCNKCC